jgi:hypothetical protein
MTQKSPKEIWSEQVEATENIKARYGGQSAFDYIVAEKLMNFTEAAQKDSSFAREMPMFIAAVRRVLGQEEMVDNLARLERTLVEPEIALGDDDALCENPATAAERRRTFAIIKELLSVATLGTA